MLYYEALFGNMDSLVARLYYLAQGYVLGRHTNRLTYYANMHESGGVQSYKLYTYYTTGMENSALAMCPCYIDAVSKHNFIEPILLHGLSF